MLAGLIDAVVPEGPLLWYVNRGTGMTLLLLFTFSIVLGVWSTAGRAGGKVPRFAIQLVHRDVALLATVMLGVHIASAVVDSYVDIRWWQSVLPWDLHYQPWWLALGIVATDLLLVVVGTSLLRHRLNLRMWRWVHLSTYASWGIAVVHGLGIGTDTGAPWSNLLYAGSVGVVLTAVLARLAVRHHRNASAPVELDTRTTVLR